MNTLYWLIVYTKGYVLLTAHAPFPWTWKNMEGQPAENQGSYGFWKGLKSCGDW